MIGSTRPRRFQPLQRAGLVGGHEARIADDVGCEHGGQPPFHPSLLQPAQAVVKRTLIGSTGRERSKVFGA
jgi:hypothetical protein